MIEKNIYLDSDSLIVFYGSESKNIEKIKQLYSKLKIVVRGDEIKVFGASLEVGYFEKFIDKIKKQIDRFNKLDIKDIELIFEDKIQFNKEHSGVIIYGNGGKPIFPRSENQKKLVKQFLENDMVFAVGPAGTGKTYLSIAMAVRALKNNEVKRIILSRPAVEAGENLGFLPGDLKNKLDPYLQALYDALLGILPGA